MSRPFAGQTAVITGAASGIGLALSACAIEHGMNVVMVDLDQAALDESSRSINACNNVLTCLADVSVEESLAAVREAALDRFGDIQMLFNNAGVLLAKPAWEYTAEDWAWVLGVNLGGVTNGIRVFLPHMQRHGKSAWVVNTASVAGFLSPSGLAAYNASKQAVVAVSETLHHELQESGSGIGVSVLCPAWVPTRIDQSERIRPDRFMPIRAEMVADALDGAVMDHAMSIRSAVSKGKLSPLDIARITFSAIEQKQFYIFPHPRILPALDERFESVRQACHEAAS